MPTAPEQTKLKGGPRRLAERLAVQSGGQHKDAEMLALARVDADLFAAGIEAALSPGCTAKMWLDAWRNKYSGNRIEH